MRPTHKPISERKQQEEYETVNEGMTTDTTEAPQSAVRRGEAAEPTEAKREEEGILSDEEESHPAERK